MNILQRPAAAGVCALLTKCGLPTADLKPDHFEHFFVGESLTAPTAAVGVEIHGTCALLRSLAVLPDARRHGWGMALVAHVEAYARALGVRDLYLLTASAELFFVARGYRRIARSLAPDPIRHSQEFAHLCPDHAALMTKTLVVGTTAATIAPQLNDEGVQQ